MKNHFLTNLVAVAIVSQIDGVTRVEAQARLKKAAAGAYVTLPTGAKMYKALVGPAKRARYYLASYAPDGSDVAGYLAT